MSIEVILGPPGTGKTTKLMLLMEYYLKLGYHPQEICLISFTKKSVEEAKARAASKFNLPLNTLRYFSTLHSFAYRDLNIESNQILNGYHYFDICKKENLIYKKPSDDALFEDYSEGGQAVFLESLSRLKIISLSDVYAEMDAKIPYSKLVSFQQRLINYKKISRLVDFTDMIERFNAQKPKKYPFKVLFVDEAQDLCKLQWKMVEILINNAEHTYIAGDDDQAIFRWSGADPDLFIKIANNNKHEVLEKSYRVPRYVFNKATELIRNVKDRVKKNYSPATWDGSLSYVNNLNELPLAKGNWLILARNNRFLMPITFYLKACGYSYICNRYGNYDSDIEIKALKDFEKIRLDKTDDTEDLDNLQNHLSNNNAIDIKSVWSDFLNISDANWKYADKLVRKNEAISPRITLSTIHGAKGGESDNVLIILDTNKLDESLMDDEYRIFYVALTRTKYNLYLQNPATNNYFEPLINVKAIKRG